HHDTAAPGTSVVGRAFSLARGGNQERSHEQSPEPDPKAGPAVAATGPRRPTGRAAGWPAEARPADPEARSRRPARYGRAARPRRAEPAALVNRAGKSLADPGFGRGFALVRRRRTEDGRQLAD